MIFHHQTLDRITKECQTTSLPLISQLAILVSVFALTKRTPNLASGSDGEALQSAWRASQKGNRRRRATHWPWRALESHAEDTKRDWRLGRIVLILLPLTWLKNQPREKRDERGERKMVGCLRLTVVGRKLWNEEGSRRMTKAHRHTHTYTLADSWIDRLIDE